MALEDDVRKLGNIPAFRKLEPEALRLIAFSAETRILRNGDVLFRAGDVAESGFVLLSGSVALQARDGTRATLVTSPALIGETALLVETKRPATAVANAPSVILKISRTLFRRVLAEFPESAERLRTAAAKRLLAIQGELDEFGRSLRS